MKPILISIIIGISIVAFGVLFVPYNVDEPKQCITTPCDQFRTTSVYQEMLSAPLDEPAEYTPQQRYDDLVKERHLAIIESQISQNLTPQQRDKIMQNYYRINNEMRALQLEYDIEE